MPPPDVSLIRHGPFTAYLTRLAGCPDLAGLIRRVPAEGPVVWLDSARVHPQTGRWSLLGFDPWLTLVCRDGLISLRTGAGTRTWRGDPLEALRRVLRRYQVAAAPGSPHAQALGLLGFLGYECNRWIERLPARRARPDAGRLAPDMLWLGMRVTVLVDHLERRSWLLSLVDPHAPSPAAHRRARAALERARGWLCGGEVCDAAWPAVEVSTPQPQMPQARYEAMVARVLEHVRAGDIFQANVSQRFAGRYRGPAWPLYLRLRRINPSPFACYAAWEDLRIVSCSPERLVKAQAGSLEARPIAGTRPRGATPADDVLQELELLLSEKERAEHVMLVDLARNDLGRVCRVGSVRVEELMGLEWYSHVVHIVSSVTGRLAPGRDAVDVIRALFPGGTITGCPKVRCMEILAEVEPLPRGIYTGSVGSLAFDGTMDLNIAIRTLVLEGEQLSFHVGAGIVADSVPEREYAETLAKGQALLEAVRAVRSPVPAGQMAARG
jgi:anthranilate/para-aminobenzoate synthase component I